MAIIRLSLLFAAAVMAGCTATNAPASPPPAATANPTATLTIERGVQADGPGASVSEALANMGSFPNLVNGIELKDAGGRVWLCEALVKSSPPQCAEPRLLVLNMSPEDTTFVEGPGQVVHVADGVRWIDRVQLFGIVRPS
jgi:hypothetical protein